MLGDHSSYFTLRVDALNHKWFLSLPKMSHFLCMLAYDSVAVSSDEYIKMVKSPVLELLKHFCRGVILCFGEEYSRCLTFDDLRCVLAKGMINDFMV